MRITCSLGLPIASIPPVVAVMTLTLLSSQKEDFRPGSLSNIISIPSNFNSCDTYSDWSTHVTSIIFLKRWPHCLTFWVMVSQQLKLDFDKIYLSPTFVLTSPCTIGPQMSKFQVMLEEYSCCFCFFMNDKMLRLVWLSNAYFWYILARFKCNGWLFSPELNLHDLVSSFSWAEGDGVVALSHSDADYWIRFSPVFPSLSRAAL